MMHRTLDKPSPIPDRSRPPRLSRSSARAHQVRILDTPVSHIRSGHRGEYSPRNERIPFNQRLDNALLDLGLYRTIALKDFSAAHFDGHPYATRRAVERLKRDGLIEEHTSRGPKRKPYKVLTLTDQGHDLAQALAPKHGLDPDQQVWSHLVKRSDTGHEVAVYRAGRAESARLEKDGARIKRIRLDAELKRTIAQKTETARNKGGRPAADMARRQAAEDLGLPVQDDKVIYPDAQIEYDDAAGRTGRVNIEVVTDNYRSAAIVAKAKAGFALYGSSGASARAGRTLRNLNLDDRPGSLRGPADRERASIDL